MAREFKEVAHNRTDKEKFNENFDAIDWSALRDKPLDKEKAKRNTKHSTSGMCGEFGMSTFDKEAFDNNYDNIKWSTDEN